MLQVMKSPEAMHPVPIPISIRKNGGSTMSQQLTKQMSVAAPSPPRWLDQWNPGQTTFASLKEIEATGKAYLKSLDPCGPKTAMVLLEQALAHFEDKQPSNIDVIMPHYVQAIAELPEDLAFKACQHVIRRSKYPTWPKLSAFLDPVEMDLVKRRQTLKKLRQMHSEAQPPTGGRKKTRKEKEHVTRVMNEIRKAAEESKAT